MRLMGLLRSPILQATTSKNLQRFGLFSVSTLSALLTALPSKAAERISFVFGPFQENLSVNSLAEFADSGKVNSDLAFYFSIARVDEKTKATFREAIRKRPDIDPILLSRFFYSEVGEDIISRLGRVVNMPRGLSGKYALRSALILAALEPEGLTLVNFLRKYPTDVWLDVEDLLILSQAIDRVVRATTFITAEVAQAAAQEAATGASIDFANLPDLTQPGSFGVEQQRWQLTDSSRNRSFYVDVYRPKSWRAGKTPVVIFSHGLASRPEDFAQQAQHLASYGYVVALPQHPGSDAQQINNLIRGLSQQVFLKSDFFERPRDVSYVIDELERRNAAEFAGQLDLQSVGVMGHSFGGYTALALAGATIDFDFLQQECERLLYLNTSLLLECRALSLPREPNNFRDPRVTAVFAANPVNYSTFGPQGLGQIQIPVMIATGTYDPATPAVLAQGLTFPALTTPNKYLAVIEGQAHVDFSKLDAGITQAIDSIAGLTLPSPQLILDYSNAIQLAFFEVHQLNNEDYRPYLQSAYAKYLSQDQKFKMMMITAASDAAIKQTVAGWLAQNPRREP